MFCFRFQHIWCKEPEGRRDGKPLQKIKAIPELRGTQEEKWQSIFFLTLLIKTFFVLLTNIQKNIKNIKSFLFFKKSIFLWSVKVAVVQVHLNVEVSSSCHLADVQLRLKKAFPVQSISWRVLRN